MGDELLLVTIYVRGFMANLAANVIEYADGSANFSGTVSLGVE